MSIHYGIGNLLHRVAPLYYQYPHRSEPQKSYLEMSEDGFVTAGWDTEISDSIPMYVRNLEYFRWPLSPNADGESLHEFLRSDPMHSLLERVHKGHSVEQDGYRQVGKLTEDAQKASLEIELILNEKPYLERKVYHVKNWLESRFSADDVVASSHINAYIQNVYGEAMNVQESECAAFFGNWSGEVERLCANYVNRSMEESDAPNETARNLARMLVEYNPDDYEYALGQCDAHTDEVLPFNQDGHFDTSRQSEETQAAAHLDSMEDPV